MAAAASAATHSQHRRDTMASAQRGHLSERRLNSAASPGASRPALPGTCTRPSGPTSRHHGQRKRFGRNSPMASARRNSRRGVGSVSIITMAPACYRLARGWALHANPDGVIATTVDSVFHSAPKTLSARLKPIHAKVETPDHRTNVKWVHLVLGANFVRPPPQRAGCRSFHVMVVRPLIVSPRISTCCMRNPCAPGTTRHDDTSVSNRLDARRSPVAVLPVFYTDFLLR